MNGCCNHIQLEGMYELKFEGDHSAMVYADQQKIEQVLVNLVNNAIKYAANSLEITLNVERLASGGENKRYRSWGGYCS